MQNNIHIQAPKSTKSNHGHRSGPASGPISGSVSGPIMEQVPVSTAKTTEIWFDDQNSDIFIRLIATNDRTVTGYDTNSEYWYTSTDVSINDVSSVTLHSSSSTYSANNLDTFIGGFTKVFQVQQVIGTSGWTEGTYTPTASQKRLYKAVDPDNSSNWIAILIEQSSNALVSITWYKQTNTGTIFGSSPSSLTFSLVTHEGNPSTNPAHIASGTWYYVHSS